MNDDVVHDKLDNPSKSLESQYEEYLRDEKKLSILNELTDEDAHKIGQAFLFHPGDGISLGYALEKSGLDDNWQPSDQTKEQLVSFWRNIHKSPMKRSSVEGASRFLANEDGTLRTPFGYACEVMIRGLNAYYVSISNYDKLSQSDLLNRLKEISEGEIVVKIEE